jgi:hypothetical protein
VENPLKDSLDPLEGRPIAVNGLGSRRLDEAKVETLRFWGEGLRTDPRDEVRAAGRAITMLVEEVERLNIDLWHARADARDALAGSLEAPQRPLPPPLPLL